MSEIDTSTAAIAALMDGVTPGPWETGQSSWNDDGDVQYVLHGIRRAGYADCMFIAAARDLVPALAAERDALRAEVERLRGELSVADDVFAGIADHILAASTDIPPNHKGIFADCQRAGMKIRAALKGSANG